MRVRPHWTQVHANQSTAGCPAKEGAYSRTSVLYRASLLLRSRTFARPSQALGRALLVGRWLKPIRMTPSTPPVLLPEEVVEEPVYDGSTPLRVARREHFAQFYVHNTRGCAAQAARLAGYSQDLDARKTEGARVLAVADIRERVNYL